LRQGLGTLAVFVVLAFLHITDILAGVGAFTALLLLRGFCYSVHFCLQIFQI
jgi:hypothetical protein